MSRLPVLGHYYRHYYDYEMRECIGKTDDVHVSLCMHSAIVAREMAAKGVIVCRVCNTPLPEGKGRYNDHKVLRHPECVQPICKDCATNNPDAFHIAFTEGDRRMHVMSGSGFPQLYLEAARMAYDIELLGT
jgi:quinolinate synthase